MSDADELIQHNPDDIFEQALRSELHWEAPPELTARLLALVPGGAAMGMLPDVAMLVPGYVRPKTWYTVLVLSLTAMIIGLSLAIAWQFYGLVGSQLGLTGWWQQIQVAPDLGLRWLYAELPLTRYIVAILSSVRDQLHWLLLAVVLWLALDGWSPNFAFRQQQTS